MSSESSVTPTPAPSPRRRSRTLGDDAAHDGGTLSERVPWFAGDAPSGDAYSYVLTSTTDGTSATGSSVIRPNFMHIMTDTAYASNTTIHATFSYVTTNGVVFTGQLNGVAADGIAVDLPAESIVKSEREGPARP